MKKDILYYISRYHRLTIVYTAIISPIILLSGCTVICIVALISHRLASLSLLWIFLAALSCDLLFFFLFRCRYRAMVSEPRKTKPYSLRLGWCDSNLIEDGLIQRLSMKDLPTGDYYSYSEGKKNTLFLLFQVDSFNKKESAKRLEKSTRAARRLVGLKTEMSVAQAKDSCRINIFLHKKITEDALDQLSINAVYGMRYAEAVLNVYLDMDTSTLIIPSYISLWNGGSSMYCYCVKILLDSIVTD